MSEETIESGSSDPMLNESNKEYIDLYNRLNDLNKEMSDFTKEISDYKKELDGRIKKQEDFKFSLFILVFYITFFWFVNTQIKFGVKTTASIQIYCKYL